MPNWCYNSVDIHGDKEVLEKLIAFVGRPITKVFDDGPVHYEEPVFSFENVKPSTPDKTLDSLFLSKGADDWYANNVNSWGTKWDIANSESLNRHITDTFVVYSFDSAYSPPSPVIERLAEIFPEVTINHTYYETGFDFWGIDTYEKGERTKEKGGSLNHKAWTEMSMECWQCEQYNENPDDPDYFEWLYNDCPAKKKANRKKKKEVTA